MARIYTLSLALWLAFSTQAWAIAFVFQEESSTEPSAQLSIAVQLSENEEFFANLVSIDENQFGIQSSGAFQRLDFAYSFFGFSADVALSTSSFTNSPLVDLDQITFRPTGLSHASRTIGLTGFSSSDFLGLWTFEMGVDDEDTPRPVITGSFVAVPEPTPLALASLGLMFMVALVRRRAASTPSNYHHNSTRRKHLHSTARHEAHRMS